jgi:glycosidase
MKQNFLSILIISAVVLAVVGLFVKCSISEKKPVPSTIVSEVKHIDWSKNAVIYEVNLRQYSINGTLKEFTKDLPRLKELGIDIIWVMPINPIGEKNRKGPLGSYYSVKDYKAINPEYGTMDDFKAMVKETHNLGMKLIIDWVPNHSAWDNALLKEHPEYYLKDSTGKMVSPFDWTDVVRFDYKNAGMRKWMIETMKFWLTEADIDGFRCDVAHMVPVDFWDTCRIELDKVKPIFFLAEADQPFLHNKAFDASYDWRFHHVMNDIAKGKKNANAIPKHFAWADSIYPQNSYLMEFTSNHDENSWNGTEHERLGAGVKTFAVVSATVPGMLLVYNGQESGFNRRLKFFEKDSIDWGKYPLTTFYKKLIDLKHRNSALWNGSDGGSMVRLSTNNDSSVFVFYREKESHKVLVICNLKPKQINLKIKDAALAGKYKEIFTSNEKSFEENASISLAPWEYFVYEKE